MRTLLLSIPLLFIGICVPAQETTKWRGPERSGFYPDRDLLRSWPEDGPEIIWHFDELGEGYSSPAFANGKIYLSGMVDQTGYIFILSTDGRLIKRFPYGPEFSSSYPGSRSTPVVAGDKLYMYSGLGRLSCFQADEGSLVWSKEAFSDFDGRNIQWGVTETPVIDGDMIYICPGGKKHNVVALNRNTGELIWSCRGKGELSAYNSPQLIDLPGRKLLVTMMASHTLGIDAATGELLWTQHQPNTYSVHANTPLYHDGGLYCFSGYGRGGFKLELDDEGAVESKSWTTKLADSRMGGAVLIDGYIYGSGDRVRAWKCLDWETGREEYSATSIGNGVVIAADGLLFLYSQRGELALAEVTPEEFRLLASTRVRLGSGQHWAHPAIHKGVLYLRHGNTLIAYKISK